MTPSPLGSGTWHQTQGQLHPEWVCFALQKATKLPSTLACFITAVWNVEGASAMENMKKETFLIHTLLFINLYNELENLK